MNSTIPPPLPSRPSLAPVEQLARARAHCAWRTIQCVLGALVLVTVGVLAAIDTQWPWPDIVRASIAAAGVAGLAAVVARRKKRNSQRYTPLEAARVWEQAHPECGQRIRAALEVRSRGGQHRFAEHLLNEASEELGRHSWQGLVPRARLRKWIALAALASACIVVIAIKWADFRLGLARIIAPGIAGSYTRVAWVSLPKTFDENHLPRVAVSVGRRPAVPMLHVRPRGGDWKTVPLAALPDGRAWDVLLSGYGADLQVYAQAGDGRTRTATILYRPPPKLVGASTTLAYPAYTGVPKQTRPTGDVRAVEGTNVEWRFKFNVRPEHITWEFGGHQPVSVALDPDGTIATVRWKAVAGKFSAVLGVTDAAGAPLNSWRFSVEGVKDALPEVEILDLKKNVEATPVAELPVRIRAKDDYGVAEIGLVLEAAGERVWVLEKAVDKLDQHVLTEFATVALEKFPLTINDNVRIYAYALDHKPRGGARAVSPLKAIDIREFKKLFQYMASGGGLTGEQLEMATEALKSLEELIKAQRAVVSDVFVARETSRASTDDATALVGKMPEAQEAVRSDAADLHEAWTDLGFIPRDDLTLLSSAVDQMNEARRSLEAAALDPAFDSADRALSTLLQLRRQLLTVFMNGQMSGQPLEEEGEEDMPKTLAALAEEARRLAREERDVQSQLAGQGEENAMRRQQEIAVSDAGELYSALVDHPDRQEDAIQLMDEAERAMRGADAALHSTNPSSAQPGLALGEQRLNELADFLKALEIENAAQTLRDMAAELEGRKPDGGKKEGEQSGGSPSKGSDSGSGQGAGKPDTQKQARAAELDDKKLGAMADRAGQGEGNEGKGFGDDLSKLREDSGIGKLAQDAARLAQLQGEGRGDTPDARGLGANVDAAGAKAAQSLRDEAARMDATRAAQIAAAKAMANDLAGQLADGEQPGDEAGQPDGQKPGAGDQGDQQGQGDGQGEGDQPGNGNGPSNSDQPGNAPGSKPGKGPKPGEGEGDNAGPTKQRSTVKQLEKSLERLNDEKLGYLVIQLQDEPFNLDSLPVIESVQKRLDEMLAALPNAAPSPSAGRIPETNRREIEDYYRGLSDDFGGEQWQAPSE